MLIHPNIPSWQGAELQRALFALARVRPAAWHHERLCAALEQAVPGWRAAPVRSGGYALVLALEALGLKGRSLGVPAYVCPSVVTALRAAGATIVSIDCQPGSTRFDPDGLRQAVRTNRLAGIVAANTYGFDQDFALLRELGVPVIDDAAYQAGRNGIDGRPCGTRGDAGVWSFNFKALSGLGGGVLLLPAGVPSCVPVESRRAPAADVVRFANYGLRSLVRHHVPRALPGGRFRAPDTAATVRAAWRTLREGPMSDLQAAVALGQWERRAELARTYASQAARLVGAVRASEAFVPLDPMVPPAGSQFVPVLVRTRRVDAAAAVDDARRSLYADGILTETAYPSLSGAPVPLPHASDLSARLFLLPCHASLKEKQIQRIVSAVRRASDGVTRRFRIEAETPDLRAACP